MNPSKAPTDYDHYVLSRLLVGHSLNGELEQMSPEFQSIGENLANLEPKLRWNAFNETLDARDDFEAIRAAIMKTNPNAPYSPMNPVETGEASTEAPSYQMVCFADIEAKPIEWLWPKWIPRGMLTLIAGDPGLGKSLFTIDIAARVTKGEAFPPHFASSNQRGYVIFLSAEDDPSRTIKPRLITAGADLENVHLLESVTTSEGKQALPSLGRDLEQIELAIDSLSDCRLLVIDPVSAYLSGTDDHRNSELRGVLTPLKEMAERRNVAVLLVTHLSKAGGTNSKHRVIGSIAYTGACRAGFLFIKDNDDPEGRRILMTPNKCNIGQEPPTLAYRVAQNDGGPFIEWEKDTVSITADEALARAAESRSESLSESNACDAWLRESLKQAGGRMPATEIIAAGKEASFSKSQLERAKQRIGAKTHREGFGDGSACYWVLTQ